VLAPGWQATNQSLRIPAYDTSIKARLQNGENQQFKHNTAAAAQCVLAALTLSQGSRLLVDTMDWLRSRAERMAARETDLAAAVKDVQFFTDIEEHLGLAVVSEVATVAMVPAADTAADTAAAADPAPVATGAVAVELAAAVAASASVQQRLVSCLICLEEVTPQTTLHTSLHTHVPTYMHVSLHTYTPTYIYTHIRTYILTYIHTCIPNSYSSRHSTRDPPLPTSDLPLPTLDLWR